MFPEAPPDSETFIDSWDPTTRTWVRREKVSSGDENTGEEDLKNEKDERVASTWDPKNCHGCCNSY